MTMILDDSMVSRAENDYAKITQISALGSLADTVLRELIDIEIGAAQNSLVGIPLAERAFRDASASLGHPRNIWDVPSTTEELLHFSSPAALGPAVAGSAPDKELGPWLDMVADALKSVAGESPSEESIDVVRREFTQIANETMKSAAQLARSRYLPA